MYVDRTRLDPVLLFRAGSLFLSSLKRLCFFPKYSQSFKIIIMIVVRVFAKYLREMMHMRHVQKQQQTTVRMTKSANPDKTNAARIGLVA